MPSDIKTWLVLMTAIGQVAILSFLGPYREHWRVQALEARYPRDRYALAYRTTGQKSAAWRRTYAAISVAVGFGALVFLLRGRLDAEALSLRMFWVLLAQTGVLLIDAPRLYLIRRWLRRVPPPAVRTADMRPRHITDYVPTWLMALTLVAWLAFALISVTTFPKVSGPPFWVALATGIVNVLLLVRIVQRMRGFLTFQRADPYMTPPDRLKVGQMHASRLFRVSTIYSVLASILLLEASGKAYIDGTYVAVALSVYLQFGFVLVGLWLRKFYAEVDFDAYREGPPSGPVALAAANCD